MDLMGLRTSRGVLKGGGGLGGVVGCLLEGIC